MKHGRSRFAASCPFQGMLVWVLFLLWRLVGGLACIGCRPMVWASELQSGSFALGPGEDAGSVLSFCSISYPRVAHSLPQKHAQLRCWRPTSSRAPCYAQASLLLLLWLLLLLVFQLQLAKLHVSFDLHLILICVTLVDQLPVQPQHLCCQIGRDGGCRARTVWP